MHLVLFIIIGLMVALLFPKLMPSGTLLSVITLVMLLTLIFFMGSSVNLHLFTLEFLGTALGLTLAIILGSTICIALLYFFITKQ